MKATKIILAVVLVLVTVFAMASCDCEHVYEEAITVDPTCTAEGVKTFTCGLCGDSYTKPIEKAEHNYTAETVAPTCVAGGYTTHTCSVCGDSYKSDETPKLDEHSYVTETVAPTCVAGGYTVHTCSACGDSYKSDETPKLDEHSYVTETVAPTCVAGGYTVHTCSACGDSYKSDETPAIGDHNYTETVTQEPTCSTEGTKVLTCSLCGESHTETVAKLAHDYTTTALVPPTCIATGSGTYTCDVCGEVYTETLPMLDTHNYVAVVTAQPTCADEGVTTHTCSVCGDFYTTPIDVLTYHSYVLSVEPLTPQQERLNPDAIGVETLVCSACSDKQTTGNAVLVFMDFNEVPTDLDTYEGSDDFKAGKFATKKEPVKAAGVYIDQQAHTDAAYRDNDDGFAMYGDGVLTKLNGNGYFRQDFMLGNAVPKYTDATISFDIIINKSPVDFTDAKFKTFQCFFSVADRTTYDTTVFSLCLNNVNLSADPDSTVAELYVINRKGGNNDTWNQYPTGYEVTIGKQYSFKVELSTLTAEKIYQGTVYVKADGEAEYTKLGTYDYVPNTGNNHGAISFGPNKHAKGNIIDNYVLTTPLTKHDTCNYVPEVTTKPTCTTDGEMTYTCSACGDTYKETIPMCHDYVMSVEALTAEQVASNPDAIGVEVQTCSVCGKKNVTENAVLVFMDFNEVPTDLDTYEGSDDFKAGKFATKKEPVKAAGVYIDQQAHTDAAYRDNDDGFAMYGDGVLTKLNGNGYFRQDFMLGNAVPKYTDATISFDIIINKSPVGFTDEKFKTFQCFFSVADRTTYNTTVFSLCLNNVKLNTDPDSTVAELYVINRRGSSNEVWNEYATGYKVTVGEAYSFKIELSPSTNPKDPAKTQSGTVYVKAAAEAEYTKLGTYDYVPNTGSTSGAISFGPNKHANGNIIDNYKLTTPLVK